MRHLLKHGTGRNEKKTEQTEGYGTDYYGIRNKDRTNRMQKDGTGGTKRNRILRNTEHRRNIRIANGRNDTEHSFTIIRNTERIYGTQLLQYVTSKVAKHRRLKSLRCSYNHCRSLR